MAFHPLLVLAIVQVRTDGADGDEDDVEAEMKMVVSLVNQFVLFFPNLC